MNLYEYIKKNGLADFGIQEINKIANNQSISTIFRLDTSYGEASKIGIYDDDDSLN